MKWQYTDGGRSKYFSGLAGDCVVRAFTIGLEKDYLCVYEKVNLICKEFIKVTGQQDCSSSIDGVYPWDIKRIGKYFGLKFNRKKGLTKHLKNGNYLVLQGGHITCVKNGKILDTHDTSEEEYYGYFKL
jgi:hypothetical protein